MDVGPKHPTRNETTPSVACHPQSSDRFKLDAFGSEKSPGVAEKPLDLQPPSDTIQMYI